MHPHACHIMVRECSGSRMVYAGRGMAWRVAWRGVAWTHLEDVEHNRQAAVVALGVARNLAQSLQIIKSKWRNIWI